MPAVITTRVFVLFWAMAVALTTIPALADSPLRTVSVDGTASVTRTPDMARVSLAVVARQPQLDAARREAATVTNRVLALTDKLGIERRHVNSTGITVRPDYRWNRDKDEQELRGYVVQRSIEIELRDLDRLGELIEQAVGTGVNQVSPPILDTSTRREAYREALGLAVVDARSNAEALARAAGERLGVVQSMTAGGSYPSPMPLLRASADMAMAEAAESYNAAELRFEANVSVTFELSSSDRRD